MGAGDLRLVLDVAQFLFTGLIWAYVWYARRQAATAAELATHDRRLVAVEVGLTSTPSKDSINAICVTLERVDGDVKVMAARLEGLGEVVNRVEVVVNRQEEFLLKMSP